MNKRIPALVLSCLMVLACATGCEKKIESTKVISSPDAAVTQKVLDPGVEYNSELGSVFTYEKKNIDITLIEISKTSKKTDSEGMCCYALFFKAKNNGSEDIDINVLDDFNISTNSEKAVDKLFSAISAANAALTYQGYTRYDTILKPGEEFMGFVPFQAPEDWTEMRVAYKPDLMNSNDYIVYNLTSNMVLNKYEEREQK